MSKQGWEMKYPFTLSHVFRHSSISFLRKLFFSLNKAKPRFSKIITGRKSSHWKEALTLEIHLSLGDFLRMLLLQPHIKPPSLNKHMSRFCKVGNGGGRISLLEGPAGPHSLNACSPDVCLSLILLKESACFLTGLCWADEENGPPLPLASPDLSHPHPGFIYPITQPPLSSDHNAARADRGAVVATIHSMLPLLLCSC